MVLASSDVIQVKQHISTFAPLEKLFCGCYHNFKWWGAGHLN